jgi:hypothetical protein
VQFGVLYFVQHPQIFQAIVGVLAVTVVHLLILLKRLDKRVRYKPMHQKRPARLSSWAAVTQTHLNVRFCASCIFFGRQTHDAFGNWNWSVGFSSTKTSQGLDPAKRAHLVSALVSLNVGPHFSTSSVALRLLHGYPLRFFLR